MQTSISTRTCKGDGTYIKCDTLTLYKAEFMSFYQSNMAVYGCETWATTKYLLSHLDAFDTWALRKILRSHVSNAEVRRTTGCSPLSHLVTKRRLWLFGHISRSSPRENHNQALAACIWQVLPDWKRPAGRPSHTGLRATEADLGPLNFGLVTAWRKATTWDEWRHIVDIAMLHRSTLWKKKNTVGVAVGNKRQIGPVKKRYDHMQR